MSPIRQKDWVWWVAAAVVFALMIWLASLL
jgi:hypothetical protein